ncbi:MAG TPA: hypothetical protein VNS58_15245 [Puia sp.]|nr:hypothetical protein [Puia sp.]
MKTSDLEEEKALLTKLKNKEIQAFKRFYEEYSEDLLIVAFCLLESVSLAIKAVDDLFERLWMEATFESIDPPIHRFLYRELRKNCENKRNGLSL